jgi:hypothetical protein
MSDASIVHLSRGKAQMVSLHFLPILSSIPHHACRLPGPLSIEYSKMVPLFQVLEAQISCEKIF